MAASNVKLLGGRPSPYVNRVQFALNLKSVDYEFIIENFPEKSELLLKSNPVHKKIPVLIHGDKPICESLVIVQYIDEVWSDGPSILPSDPSDRATARFWAAYVDEKWFPSLWGLRTAKDEESKAVAVDKIVEGLKFLEEVLLKSSSEGKGFFGGDNIGYLDIALGCYLGWLKTIEIMSEQKILVKTPSLSKWAERFSSHKTIKGTLPEAEELIDYVQKRQAKAVAETADSSK